MLESNNHFVNNFDASNKSSMFEFLSLNLREISFYRYALYNLYAPPLILAPSALLAYYKQKIDNKK